MADNQQGIRLKNFVELYCGLTIFSFCKKVLNKEATILYNVINGKNELSLNVLMQIRERYPELNQDWMISGKGNMISGVEDGINERIIQYIKYLKLNNSTFGKLCQFDGFRITKGIINEEEIAKIIKRYPELSEVWLRTGKGDMLNKSDLPPTDSNAEYYVDKVVPDADKSDEQHIAAEGTIKFGSVPDQYHGIHEGTKGLVIPFNLGNCDKITGLDLKPITINNIISNNFTFFYQLQTYELWPQLSKGDWLLLESVDINNLADGEVYLINTKPYKVKCRIFRRNQGQVELVDINGVQDTLILNSMDDIKEAFVVISALRNNPLVPLSHSEIGRELSKRDKMLSIRDQQITTSLQITQDSININKSALEEIIRSNKRIETLIFNKGI